MNFLNGSVASGGIDVPGLKATVPTSVALPVEGEAVTAGLRPEHIEIDLAQ